MKRLIIPVHILVVLSAVCLPSCIGSTTELARNELDAARRLLEPLPRDYQALRAEMDRQTDLTAPVRLAVLNHARRAAQLDSSNEEAQYLVVVHADAALSPQERKNRVAVADSVLPECSLYIRRFGSQAPEHHRNILDRQFNVGLNAFASIHDWTKDDDILRPPDTRAFPYTAQYVRAMAELGYRAEIDERYELGNIWEAFSYHLVRYVIPSCPPDMLDSEYAYWEGFWRDRRYEIEHPRKKPGPRTYGATRPLPWGMIAACFAARKKDVQGVRHAFQQAALEIPKEDINVWGGNGFNQRFERLVPLYLKAAGDPEGETWEPEFPNTTVTK